MKSVFTTCWSIESRRCFAAAILALDFRLTGLEHEALEGRLAAIVGWVGL